MLKKVKNDDLDELMQFWKNEVAKYDKKINNDNFSQEYTKVKSALIKNISSTIIYTEDGELNGFISINKLNNEIDLIIIKQEIRREGIGSILIENYKKQCNELKVKVERSNTIAVKFFESNGFKEVKNNKEVNDNSEVKNNKEVNDNKGVNEKVDIVDLIWNKNEKKVINLIYFDNSIDEEEIIKHNDINYYPINVKQAIKNDEVDVDNVKTYMKLRKKIESSMKADLVLLYIDYNEYHEFMDDIIKDVAKINKVNLNIVVCEPFSVEGAKKSNIIKKIETSYSGYMVHKIDCTVNFSNDITINQIFQKRSEIVLQKIEKIAQN